MDNRHFECKDGSRWTVSPLGRSSLYRMEIVFESADEPGLLLRGEVSAQSIDDLTDDELCFVLGELRA